MHNLSQKSQPFGDVAEVWRVPSRVTLDYSAGKPTDAVRPGSEIERMPDC
jgi:outer membrane protein W